MSVSLRGNGLRPLHSQTPYFKGLRSVPDLSGWGKVARQLVVGGNYIDQSAVVRKYGKVVNPLMLLGGAGLAGWHTWKAQPEERKKVLTRDGLVLGATIGGTMLAAGGLASFRQVFQPKYVPKMKNLLMEGLKPLHAEGESLIQNAEENLAHSELAAEVKTLIREKIADAKALAKKANQSESDAFLSRDHLFEIYNKIRAHHPKDVSTLFGKVLGGEEEGLKDEVKEAASFFSVGLAGVVSGIMGGLLANKINHENDPEKTPNMVKEGIFQFVANIAMCAVGAGSALALMKPTEWIHKVPKLSSSEKVIKAAKEVTRVFNETAGSRIYRFGGVLGGLSVGILGGAHIANFVGRHWVNPVLDKMQGKQSKPPEQQGKRHIEGMDMVLHVDDIPTAAAIAGTAILGPWIMPFFPVSGYKAGIGYRNDGHPQKHGDQHGKKQPESHAAQVPHRKDMTVQSHTAPPFSVQTAYSFPRTLSATPPNTFGMNAGLQPFAQSLTFTK